MYAVKHNSQEIANLLIQNGAQKDLQNKATAGRGVTGHTRAGRWNSGDSYRVDVVELSVGWLKRLYITMSAVAFQS